MSFGIHRVRTTVIAPRIAEYLELEQSVSSKVGWPDWALRCVAVLSLLIVSVQLLEILVTNTRQEKSKKSTEEKAKGKVAAPTTAYRLFQLQYLSVYLIIMLADWLQGTNMYTLYSSYGVDVGALFLTGFLSSAVFGTFLGIYVDTWGRKLGCIIFCLLEIVINLLEHIPSMPALLVGRVLGGMSTSLLFTAFESWMVSEHRKKGFNESLLASTFSISAWGNGLMAIGAGFLAQVSADIQGDIGPFQVAILLTIMCLVLVLFWGENYGGDSKDGNSDDSANSMVTSIRKSIQVMQSNPKILFLGLSQAFFEGAVYTFVFMWVPSMLAVCSSSDMGSLPTGLVFSSFMLSMTLGGMLFGMILSVFPGGEEWLCVLVYLIAAGAMAVPIFFFDFWSVLISFLVLEAMVGMFNSCGGMLRSKYYPENIQSSVMSVFRLPLNLLVVIGTKLTDNANSADTLKPVFTVVVAMHSIAFVLQLLLVMSTSKADKQKGD